MDKLIRELKELRIEQSVLTRQVSVLDNKINSLEKQIHTIAQPKSRHSTESDLQIGDIIVLLTKGVRCRKGDRARVTKVNPLPYPGTVHFTVLHNKHTTYKKRSNVKKA